MDIINFIILAFGLSVDTTLAAFSQGSFIHTKHLRQALKISLVFAFFHGIMPVLGWIFAQHFYELLRDVDHWLAFVIFLYLGGKLIYDSFQARELKSSLNFTKIILLSVAISIDSLVAGLTLSFLNHQIILPSFIIGCVTFCSSLSGFWLGHKAKKIKPQFMEIFGGALLIFLGCKVLWDHLSV